MPRLNFRLSYLNVEPVDPPEVWRATLHYDTTNGDADEQFEITTLTHGKCIGGPSNISLNLEPVKSIGRADLNRRFR